MLDVAVNGYGILDHKFMLTVYDLVVSYIKLWCCGILARHQHVVTLFWTNVWAHWCDAV